jgi:hypothetical protein
MVVNGARGVSPYPCPFEVAGTLAGRQRESFPVLHAPEFACTRVVHESGSIGNQFRGRDWG